MLLLGMPINLVTMEIHTGVPHKVRSTIPLSSIQSKKSKSTYYRDMCTLMFITALFTMAKIWNQSPSPSIEDWTKAILYIYTGRIT